MGRERPPVSVVVPFLGDSEDAAALIAALGSLAIRRDDELVVGDNTDHGAFARLATDGVRAVRATAERSSYHARNVAARETSNDWLLFIDADCAPAPDLIDGYFAAPVPDICGAVAGQIVGDPSQRSFVASYARARNFLSQTEGLHGKARGAAATGNLLVRRAAFESLGGFEEGVRSGADVDLCWRLQASGWTMVYRPEATVEHRHRDRVLPFLATIVRYGAGARWLNERYPGASPRWPLVQGLLGATVDVGRLLFRGHLAEAGYRAFDGLGLIAHNVGYRRSNDATRA